VAALGPCASLSGFININELTTVAAVPALAPFMSSLSAIGSSPSDVSTIDSAFTLVYLSRKHHTNLHARHRVAPQATGNIHETATITDQTTGFHTYVALAGTAVPAGAPAYTLSSYSVTFPSRTIDTTSVPTTVTLTSSGTQTLDVTGIAISGAVNNNFTQTNNCSSVPVNSTCSINITFAPTATGPQSATVQITSSAVDSPAAISVSGTATSP
jgi:hypothetical protein